MPLALSLLAGPLLAQGCPAAPDHGEEIARLLESLSASRSGAEAQAIAAELWALRMEAPDARAQALLDEGMEARAAFDVPSAREIFDRLVAYCPAYAEGYNQRAFAAYLGADFAAALQDLDRALELAPRHIGALSGKALTLMGLGRQVEAQIVLRQALALNPWLAERRLLRELPGKDI
ncbi:hypothetical protein GZA08_16725 [Pseudoroseicyclus sp. CLL3-39]|uniref:Uncharacterized protein n=2 Tax=Pseudoroseicyclus tamaricis TaxID=2705421 RepID=A0A6B2JXM9_9RHOB|nr:hypothetical protein [Pseudoroseicyclus tamaricis]